MVRYTVYKAGFLTRTHNTKRFYIGYTGQASKREDRLGLGKTQWTSHIKPGSLDFQVLRPDVESKGDFTKLCNFTLSGQGTLLVLLLSIHSCLFSLPGQAHPRCCFGSGSTPSSPADTKGPLAYSWWSMVGPEAHKRRQRGGQSSFAMQDPDGLAESG